MNSDVVETKRGAWLPLLIVQGHKLALGQSRTSRPAAAAFSSKVFKIAKTTRNVSRFQNAKNKHQNVNAPTKAPRFCIMVQEIDRLFQFNELKLRGEKIPFCQKPHITKDRKMKAID
jgi:hypothetical protein